jgi:acyl-CoA thioester hydrolase
MSHRSTPFRCLLRVRYGEVDAQQIVFNARWGDYVDVAVGEFFCAVFDAADGRDTLETRLVKQTTQWRAPARFDDVLEARVWTTRLGTSSLTVQTEFRRVGEDALLVEVETVYAAVDAAAEKSRALTDDERARLEAGATDRTSDLAGARRRHAGDTRR